MKFINFKYQKFASDLPTAIVSLVTFSVKKAIWLQIMQHWSAVTIEGVLGLSKQKFVRHCP